MHFPDIEAIREESQVPVWRYELWPTHHPTQRSSEKEVTPYTRLSLLYIQKQTLNYNNGATMCDINRNQC